MRVFLPRWAVLAGVILAGGVPWGCASPPAVGGGDDGGCATVCAGACTDLGTATAHCGACGNACGASERCTGGACVPACEGAGADCAAGDPCHVGVGACDGTTPTCADTGAFRVDGTACGAGGVCLGGACDVCVQGAPCAANLDPCREGTLACSGTTGTCVNATPPRRPGTGCGAGKVCDGAGNCLACAAGQACASNPTPCRAGLLVCATGAPLCVDAVAFRSAGASCGTNQFCDGLGGCGACTPGAPCGTNPTPCLLGQSSCLSGVPQCLDGPTPQPGGTSCGTGQACNGSGVCVACAAGTACTTNPNKCRTGVASCATGSQTCVDTTTNTSAGTPCGANLVCTSSGACVACTAGTGCATNPNQCRTGATSCATGTQTCEDTTTNSSPGTSCGTNLVCTSGGTCLACTAGAACSTNPNKCRTGVTSCATGTQTCVDTTTNSSAGTSCGANLVCTSGGACVGCTAGAGCVGNPSPCKVGTTVCSTGASVCIDTSVDRPRGTTCTATTVCNASGACVADPGCGDFTREGFTAIGTYPKIAACGGGFAVQGLTGGRVCAALTGNDSANPSGTGCSAADLCATNWHVCSTVSEVNTNALGSCASALVGGAVGQVFYATKQSGLGSGSCDPSGANDLFGCGTVVSAPAVNCLPLNATSNNCGTALPAPWSFGTCDPFNELTTVTKPGPGGGGVLCCRD